MQCQAYYFSRKVEIEEGGNNDDVVREKRDEAQPSTEKQRVVRGDVFPKYPKIRGYTTPDSGISVLYGTSCRSTCDEYFKHERINEEEGKRSSLEQYRVRMITTILLAVGI